MPSPSASSLRLQAAAGPLVAAVYSLRGCRVSWPLEPAPYDLLAEEPDGCGLARVQVKTCTTQQHGNWICWVTRSRYASVPGGKRRTPYDSGDVDVLAIVTSNLEVYLLPYAAVASRTAVTLRAYQEHRVAGLDLVGWPGGGAEQQR
jgi:hypothetical protein